MATCASCERELDPAWNYCIHCGAAILGPEIPAAIRPEPATTPATRALNPAMLIGGGVVLFTLGIAVVIVAILAYTNYLK
jgi:hypothetical protein